MCYRINYSLVTGQYLDGQVRQCLFNLQIFAGIAYNGVRGQKFNSLRNEQIGVGCAVSKKALNKLALPLITSRVWVPMLPVEPSMAMFFI
jgi:hypothetical protein